MKTMNRPAPLALALVLSLSLALPTAAAASDFTLSIYASSAINVQTGLTLEQYLPSAGSFSRENAMELDTVVNRVSSDFSLSLSSSSDQFSILLECLTDMDGDGEYEWLAESAAVKGTLTATDTLSNEEIAVWFSPGETVSLSGLTLIEWGMNQVLRRLPSGDTPVSDLSPVQSSGVLYCVTVSLKAPDAQSPYATQAYYFQVDFSAPSGRVQSELGAAAYADVPAWAWYWDAVDRCTRANLLTGNGDGTFSPSAEITRAMLLQVLYNSAASSVTAPASFPDVAPAAWYSGSISWAVDCGLVGGYSDGTFRPASSLTREQMALILQRFARVQNLQGSAPSDLSGYSDGARASYWAEEAVGWAIGNGLFSLRSNGKLDPQGTITRAELAAVLVNFQQNLQMPDPVAALSTMTNWAVGAIAH